MSGSSSRKPFLPRWLEGSDRMSSPKAKARFVMGLSATVARKDGHHPIIFMQCGPVRHRVNARVQAAARPFEHDVLVQPTAFQPHRGPDADKRVEFATTSSSRCVMGGPHWCSRSGTIISIASSRGLRQVSDILSSCEREWARGNAKAWSLGGRASRARRRG
jgi:hypothetical protein